MRRTCPRPRSLLLALSVLLTGCVPVTVNISFPQEKLEGAAGSIEDAVRSPETPKPAVQPKKGPQGRLGGSLLAALAPRAAAAQVKSIEVIPEIRIRTPELTRAIESRRARRPQLVELKARGCIGERADGMVEPRPGDACPPDVAALIASENADRAFIYDTLMDQNNMPKSDTARVRAAFAKIHRDRARPGEWVQQPDGQWTKK